MIKNLETLCMINGISGDEGRVAEYICSQLDGICEYKIDNLGNVIAFKKGKKTPKNKVLLSAHMDEVGMIVTYINNDGTLKFSTVGGVDPRVIFGKRVAVGIEKIIGVIGGAAIHNVSSEERKKAVKVNSMNIDIGCTSREETQKIVSLGDSVCFDSEFVQFGDGFIKSKALDDRVGCGIMLEIAKQDLEFDTYFSFVVQEEVGLRGATVASYSVNPDYAIVLETTTAADIAGVSDDKQVCKLKNGPVVSFMDRHTIYNKELFALAFEVAKELDIPCQTKTMVAGGNDAGAIHVSRDGVKTAAISLPCRYLHSPSCVINKIDLENSYILTKNLLDRIYNK